MPICKQCQQHFGISEEDITFYDRISLNLQGEKYHLPPPTLCPDCRLQRRLSWRNEFKLYKRHCDFSKKNIISIYAPDTQYTIYSPEIWWSDHWDPLSFGREFDFQRDFFSQFAELLKAVPRLSLICKQSENCDYCHNTLYSKNCYLSALCLRCEDCLYTYDTIECRDTLDGSHLFQCEQCYECINCRQCYGSKCLQDCENCIESVLCFDCKQLRSCFGCVNLQHKEYHIFNKKVSKEEYKKFIAECGSYSFIERQKNQFFALKKTLPLRFAKIIGTEKSSGNHVYFSKNCIHCYEVENGEDLARVYLSKNIKDCQDVFACVSLKKKQYCILNKQYSKDEYYETLEKILMHMTKTREWGEFCPTAMSPYAYNESVAYHYFPLEKEQVLERGWKWKGENEKSPIQQRCVIPDNIRDMPESIRNEILSCEACAKNFRITPQEIKFYQSLQIPLPRNCHNCRYMQRIALKNPRKLWTRECSQCHREIQTTYAPEKPERIYCEKCYAETR